MPTPIDQLQAEHRIIEKALRALAGLTHRLEQGEPVDRASLDRLFHFLSAFADQRHHQKEEKCLFPALGLHGVPRDRGPIGAMLQEHCTGRALVVHMKRAAAGLASGDANAARRFAEVARSYMELLTEHIRKEDTVLFRLAEKLLDERAMQSLQDDFDQAEARWPDTRARYEQEAEEMQNAWAVQLVSERGVIPD